MGGQIYNIYNSSIKLFIAKASELSHSLIVYFINIQRKNPRALPFDIFYYIFKNIPLTKIALT